MKNDWRKNTLGEKPGHRHEHPAVHTCSRWHDTDSTRNNRVPRRIPTQSSQGSWYVFFGVLAAVFGVVAFLLSWHGGVL